MNVHAKILEAEAGVQLVVIGDHQRILLTGKDTNQQFTLIEQLNQPGTGVPRHVHSREDEVFHVQEGEVEFEVDDNVQVLQAGELAYVPRGVPHSFKVVGNAPARVLLSIFPADIEDMFHELAQLPPGPPEFAQVAEICAEYGIHFL
ncbi:cupin domain-containing protein [Microvirga sp. STR05]|uniref:Cupin domain-containing protein n=1 Tax=Hymenobacter duratus TaxID=2771356 RepID=A0ABR8JHD5_9BACT|nr:cupin domain-containing protein [Hymenobacter duratus]MBD2715250.1 cupin domain-containing protein [Hymenobacter duratus]MBR7950157.1 cupin domain-containing protein [Microvirga sp. STR05]